MDCCTYTQEANTQFGEARAREDARAYAKSGLNGHSQAMADLVSQGSVAGASLLEIGSGVGAVTLALLKRGVSRATNVEASSAYLDQARALAQQAGVESQISYRRADFTREAAQVAQADIVLMHRVVCCYPDAPALVAAAAQHSSHLLALSYPADTWYIRLFTRLENLVRRIKGSAFRMYIHSPQTIFETASAAGLRLARQGSSGIWQIAVFERSDRS